MVRTIPNRARPRRRELLPRISIQDIWISGAAAQTIRVGHLDIGRRISRREIEAQRELNQELPDGKLRDSARVDQGTSRRKVERLERVETGAVKWQ